MKLGTPVPLVKEMTDLMHYMLLVDVVIGGTPARFLFDTGCSVTCVNRAFYDECLAPIYPVSNDVVKVSTVSKPRRRWFGNIGRPDVEPVRDISVCFTEDHVHRTLPVAFVSDISHLGAPFNINLDGILGLDALDLFRAVFDAADGLLFVNTYPKATAESV